METKIIYISSWQHPGGVAIDFEQVKAAGYAGVIIKPSQGTTYVNPYFKGDADAALAAGLIIGASPYAAPNSNDAAAEAALCIQTIAGLELALGLWLDWDDPQPLSGMDALNWVNEWFAATAGRCDLTGIYINQDQLSRVPGVTNNRKVWAADTLSGLSMPPYIQFAGAANVPGIVGLVDTQLVTNVRGINPIATAPIGHIGKVYNMPTLQQGDTGQLVRVLQHYLSEAGHTCTDDGIFGPLTADALKAWQTANGLVDDAIFGPISATHLIGA